VADTIDCCDEEENDDDDGFLSLNWREIHWLYTQKGPMVK
jgi:hypothetical protein